MSLTIIEALKKKGSTGGNTIMEAIENLPDGGSGSGSGGGGDTVVVTISKSDGNSEELELNASFNELESYYNAGKNIIAHLSFFDDGDTYVYTRYYLGKISKEMDAEESYYCARFFNPVSIGSNYSDLEFSASDPETHMRCPLEDSSSNII